MSSYGSLPIETLMGLTFAKINVDRKNDEIIFHTNDGRVFQQHHDRDCCERVYIEDVCGDVEDLLNTPVVRAEEPSSIDGVDTTKPKPGEYTPDAFKWTFYILGTNKGTVTIRWYGTSNGYYGMSVELVELKS